MSFSSSSLRSISPSSQEERRGIENTGVDRQERERERERRATHERDTLASRDRKRRENAACTGVLHAVGGVHGRPHYPGIYIYIKESGGRRGGGGGYKYRLIYGALGPEPYAAGINSAKCPFN